ncbi:hypothetical protein [Tenacibaculum ovolyticum]|uniref:hypothetical protein n=1 Tax=Tenacibaculum ovolyticum TaxID=104270 RepID=UPI001F21C5EC|nr:hypothetical protein [Tenacibaculum ovolyticum]
MNYYSAKQNITIIGTFLGFIKGTYTFHLENNDIIDFDEINIKIFEEFDLKSTSIKNKIFEITYSENFDDIDDEDIVVLKLEQLKLV